MPAAQKTIIYDWNGTLIDDTRYCFEAVNYALACHGFMQASFEDFTKFYDAPFSNLWCGLGVPRDQFNSLIHVLYSSFHKIFGAREESAKPRKGAQETLQNIGRAQIGQCVLSNHFCSSIRRQADAYKLGGFLTSILANENIDDQKKGIAKSDRLARYMRANQIAPENVIIVGDTPEETRIGKELKLITVALLGGYASETRQRAENPDYVIHELSELEPILRQKGWLS
jgi:phosphoglycolate phosphatase